jgi:phosphoglycerol transferase MdoB-like AlkP superfamily enzyme
MFTDWHKRLAKRFLFLLIPYFLLRIGFYFYHQNIYQQFETATILESLLLGMRFDIAAICLINLPIILLALVPSANSRFLKFERALFVLINLVGFIISLNDYELFLFMGKRLSFDIFAVTSDILDQLPQIARYYWYFPVVSFALAWGLSVFDEKFFERGFHKPLLKTQLIGGLFILGLSFAGIRGGLQHKSINVQSAFVQGRNELGHLVLNTPYHFLRTLKNRRIEKLHFFRNDEEAKAILLKERTFSRGKSSSKKNVVLVILESFSLEYMEQGYTPFLESLKAEGLFFERHLANGRRSIEALPSLLCGLPALIDEPLSKSIFQGNKFTCMPKLLKEAGYTNHFFHSGAKGTMGFESYSLASGFDRYFSKDDYPGEDYDGTWGIYDGPYLQYVVRMISKMPRPFLASVFTISSHQPYKIPDSMKGKFKKGTLEIHESIGYTDFALQKFFESAMKEEWFKDTIFIITADHTQKLETKKFQNIVGRYRVPLLIVGAEKGKIQKVTQHADIPHAILDLLGIEGRLPLVATSFFSKDSGRAINYADGSMYYLIRDSSLYTLDNAKNGFVQELDWETGSLRGKNPNEAIELKANLQYFINGLINNNLSL